MSDTQLKLYLQTENGQFKTKVTATTW